jgi:hypothetical protein
MVSSVSRQVDGFPNRRLHPRVKLVAQSWATWVVIGAGAGYLLFFDLDRSAAWGDQYSPTGEEIERTVVQAERDAQRAARD